MGREVDELAKSLFSNGIEVDGYNEEGWANTQKILKQDPSVLFQPTFVTQDELSARIDILTRSDDGKGWDIREVKMTTSVKPEHIPDVAFQKICLEDRGFKVNKCYLVHLNNKYIRSGQIIPEQIFISEDITEKVLARISETRRQIGGAQKIIQTSDIPDEKLLMMCTDPMKCQHLESCAKNHPGIHEAANKFRRDLVRLLLDRKILDPEKLSAEVVKSSGYKPEEPYSNINYDGIRKELAGLKYPLYFLDYETYAAAIPPFDGTRPYQQIPFQYSLHIKEDEDSPLKHKEFLAKSFSDPMPDLLMHLKADIGQIGSVFAWNASFEATRNKEMAKSNPAYAAFLEGINERMIDPMRIIQKHYVDSRFGGSTSLKDVLPALYPDKSYKDLVIQEGGEASASWPKLADLTITDAEKNKLISDMLDYCARDTEGVVRILEHLQQVILI